MSDVVDPNEGTGPEQAENMDAAHAEVSAAEAHTSFSDAGTQPEKPENMEAAHAEVAAAVAHSDWENVGLEPYDPNYQPLTTEWGNIGLNKVSPFNHPVVEVDTNAGITMLTSVGLSVFFTVTIDVIDMGYWTKVSGLGVSISTTDRGETAMNFFQHHLPAHLTYDKITLERPVSPNSINLMNWISAYHMLPVPTSAQICCLGGHGEVIMTWDMLGVTPVAYKGPNLDAASTSPAMEQLTIQHQGFL